MVNLFCAKIKKCKEAGKFSNNLDVGYTMGYKFVFPKKMRLKA